MGKITAFSRLAILLYFPVTSGYLLFFQLNRICLEKVQLKGIKFEIEGNYIILYLKALLDTGSSDTLLGDNMVG